MKQRHLFEDVFKVFHGVSCFFLMQTNDPSNLSYDVTQGIPLSSPHIHVQLRPRIIRLAIYMYN